MGYEDSDFDVFFRLLHQIALTKKFREISSGTLEVWRNSQITPHIWEIPHIPPNFDFVLKMPLLLTELQRR